MNNVSLPINRIYKDRLYKMIFNDKSELLKLYNAINGTHYDDPAMLTITTLDNAIYMTMENDLSFIIDMRLALYEQQSTVNPNLPLRFLMYIADIYSAYVKDMNIYSSKKLQIPLPSFVIFYNGVQSQPDRAEFLLSELFHPTSNEPALELKTVMLNINKGHNQELMNAYFACYSLLSCFYLNGCFTFLECFDHAFRRNCGNFFIRAAIGYFFGAGDRAQDWF